MGKIRRAIHGEVGSTARLFFRHCSSDLHHLLGFGVGVGLGVGLGVGFGVGLDAAKKKI